MVLLPIFPFETGIRNQIAVRPAMQVQKRVASHDLVCGGGSLGLEANANLKQISCVHTLASRFGEEDEVRSASTSHLCLSSELDSRSLPFQSALIMTLIPEP